jgi:hypothetical protein
VPLQLLRRRQAPDRSAEEVPGHEGGRRVLVTLAVEAGLVPVALRVERQRVDVDPAAPWGGQLDAGGPPVGLHLVAETCQRGQRRGLVRGVDVDVQIPTRPGLVANERIDAQPPARLTQQPASSSASSIVSTCSAEMPSLMQASCRTT